jgi:hypothetical protein
MTQVKVKDLIDRVAITLQDRTHVRWPRHDLLAYLNDAQRQIVLHRPDAKTVNTTFECASASKQSLPAGGLRLLAVRRNVGGRSITPVRQDTLDIQLPDWHQEPATEGVEHYVYDPMDPKTFYVYPVPDAGHEVEIVFSTAPAEIEVEAPETLISIDDIYANVIMDYMLFRAYQKDTNYGDTQKATLYLQSFNSALGLKTQVDTALVQRPGGNNDQ